MGKRNRWVEIRVALNKEEEADLIEAFQKVKRRIGAKNSSGVVRYLLANASSLLSPHAAVPAPPTSAQEMDNEEEPL